MCVYGACLCCHTKVEQKAIINMKVSACMCSRVDVYVSVFVQKIFSGQ